MQHMRAAGDAQCAPFAPLRRSLVGWPDGLDCCTDRHACSKQDDVWPSASLCSVFYAYAEEYLVDVKFVRERIGTVLFDYLVGAGERHRRRVAFGLEVERCFVFGRPQAPMS
jgi:hypothetical protein